MIICEVQQSGSKFVFTSAYKIKVGTYVLCNTVYGDSPGKVTDCFEVEDTDSVLFKKYLHFMGAYKPLKEVIGVFVPFERLRKRK